MNVRQATTALSHFSQSVFRQCFFPIFAPFFGVHDLHGHWQTCLQTEQPCNNWIHFNIFFLRLWILMSCYVFNLSSPFFLQDYHDKFLGIYSRDTSGKESELLIQILLTTGDLCWTIFDEQVKQSPVEKGTMKLYNIRWAVSQGMKICEDTAYIWAM